MGLYVRNYSGYNMCRFMALFPCVTWNDRGCGSLFIFFSPYFDPHYLPFRPPTTSFPSFQLFLVFFRPLRFFVLLSGSRILLSHQQLFLPTLFSPPWTAFQCSFFPLVCNLSLHNSRWLPRFSQDIH